MINKLIEKYSPFYYKYKLLILYVFFGGITTAVNFVVFFFCESIFLRVLAVEVTPDWALAASTTIAWIISVITAFLTNKLYVFESKGFSLKTVTKELIPFFAARILSYFFDMGITIVGVNYLFLDKLFVKIVSNVFVLIFNYAASKLFIFRNESGGEGLSSKRGALKMNETIKSLIERRSIRRFKPDPVDRETLDLIVKTGRLAASKPNGQIWHFTVVTNQDMLRDVVDAYKNAISIFDDPNILARVNDENYSNFYHAPAVIFVSAKSDAAFKEYYCANALQNMAVAAHSLGLGGCYIASFLPAFMGKYADGLNQKLQIPGGYQVLGALSVGYADVERLGLREMEEDEVNYID